MYLVLFLGYFLLTGHQSSNHLLLLISFLLAQLPDHLHLCRLILSALLLPLSAGRATLIISLENYSFRMIPLPHFLRFVFLRFLIIISCTLSSFCQLFLLCLCRSHSVRGLLKCLLNCSLPRQPPTYSVTFRG